jgi:pSer/pThr/pTyr-binding forkhead associated (FHA) protein
MPVFIMIDTQGKDLVELQLRGKVSIGRSSRCDLQIDDPKMSGTHGFFDFNQHGNLIYTDLNSSNGSFVNNNKVANIIFKIGDVLKVGKTQIYIDEARLNLKETKEIGKRARETRTDLSVPALKANLKKVKVGEESIISKNKDRNSKDDLSLAELSKSLVIEKKKIKK